MNISLILNNILSPLLANIAQSKPTEREISTQTGETYNFHGYKSIGGKYL